MLDSFEWSEESGGGAFDIDGEEDDPNQKDNQAVIEMSAKTQHNNTDGEVNHQQHNSDAVVGGDMVSNQYFRNSIIEKDRHLDDFIKMDKDDADELELDQQRKIYLQSKKKTEDEEQLLLENLFPGYALQYYLQSQNGPNQNPQILKLNDDSLTLTIDSDQIDVY